MASSARGDHGHRRQDDHVDGQHEQRRMPDVAQQAEASGDPAQRDRHQPGGDHQQRHWRDVDAEQIDLGEPHARASPSK
jgi:hypothetical protein